MCNELTIEMDIKEGRLGPIGSRFARKIYNSGFN
jgi:hypothetical protein